MFDNIDNRISIAGVLMEAYRKPVEEYPSGIKGQLAQKMHELLSKSTVFIKELYKPLITRKALVIGLFLCNRNMLYK